MTKNTKKNRGRPRKNVVWPVNGSFTLPSILSDIERQGMVIAPMTVSNKIRKAVKEGVLEKINKDDAGNQIQAFKVKI